MTVIESQHHSRPGAAKTINIETLSEARESHIYKVNHVENDMAYSCKSITSPVGTLELVASDIGLVALLWETDNPNRVRLGERRQNPDHPILRETERQLAEYFAGERTNFTIQLDMIGTSFQKKVWNALLTIPYGKTRSYGGIAKQIGIVNGSRAVGAANGRNPVSILVPCHRAIGSNGSLTGFAGGLDTKRYLLALECYGVRTAAEIRNLSAEFPSDKDTRATQQCFDL